MVFSRHKHKPNSLLAKRRLWLPRQEEICGQLELTGVNEDFEKIFEEPSGAKAKCLTAV